MALILCEVCRQPTKLRDRVLNLIEERPGIALGELRAAFPLIPYSRLRKTIRELWRSAAIETEGGRFLLAEPKPTKPPPVYECSGFIQLPSRARLMAGR